MGDREIFGVSEAETSKKGIFFTRKILIIFVIVVVILIIVTAVIAAYAAKAKVESDLKQQSENDKQQGFTTISPSEITTVLPGTVPPTSAMVTTPGSEPYWNIRLPNHTIPISYNIRLTVDMKNFTFSGYTTISVNVTKLTSKFIILHVDNMINVKLTQILYGNKVMTIKRQFEFKKNQFFVIEFNELVKPGFYLLYFQHNSRLATDLKGFYKSSYTRNGVERFVAVTQFAPTDCRRAFPSFDEPAMKAKFTISLRHNMKYTSVSNMPLFRTSTVDGDIINRFQTSIKMSTYLVVFVVGEFTGVPTSSDGVKMEFYSANDQINQLLVAIRAGNGILPFYNSFFNVSYALPKLDMIAIPDFAAGAMENWGLITYRDSTLLFANGESSESNRQSITAIVSHELAHQWFGNYVTMEWWDDVWLNEGFASYVEYLGVDHIKPKWKIHDQFVILDQYSGFALDSLVTSHPIYVKVETPDQINEIFDPISYKKGCSILRMLADFMGLNLFREGLKNYLNKYALSNAKTSDLWTSLAKVSEGQFDIGKIMDTWTLQMGFPVVMVTRTATGIKLSQERFLSTKDADTSNDKFGSQFGYLWYIPFKYATFPVNGTTRSAIKTIWFNKTKDMDIKGDFSNTIVRGNFGQNGFFRVNYEKHEWNQIAAALKSNFTRFDVADRAGLIGDVFALASSGYIDYGVALNLFDYIDVETDYVPWSMALRKMNVISGLLGKSSKAYKDYKAYMTTKIGKRFSEIDFNKLETDQLTILLNSLIVSKACSLGVQSCLTYASQLFTDWKENGKSIDPNFRSLVYYYGILNGGVKEWDYAFNKSQQTNAASEKGKLLQSLAASKEPWIISRYLKYALNESYIKSQDAPAVFGYICRSGPIGSSMGWSFFKENWSIIRDKFGSGIFLMGRFIAAVSASFSTQYELEEFNNFFEKAGDLGTVTRAVTQASEKIMARIELNNKYGTVVANWFDSRST